MYKVFAYVGSRRRANTYATVIAFIDNLKKQLPHPIDVEICTASDLNISSCQGCCSCFETGICVCDPVDNFDAVKQKMLQSDLILLASPVYAHGLSGDMKIFIDRVSYWLHLFRLAGKKSVVISTSCSNGNEFVNPYLAKILEYLGTEVVANIAVTIDTPPMLKDKLFMETVLPDSAKRTASKLISGEFSSSQRQEIYFKAMRQHYQNNIDSQESRYWAESRLIRYNSLNEYVHTELIEKECIHGKNV